MHHRHGYRARRWRLRISTIALATYVSAILVPRLMWAADAQKADDSGDAKKDATVGQTEESDYTAKHFWLLSGAVILNPFTIKADSNSSTGLVLDKEASTTAHAFIEGGFRYRWAWLDRVAPAAKKCKPSSATETAKGT